MIDSARHKIARSRHGSAAADDVRGVAATLALAASLAAIAFAAGTTATIGSAFSSKLGEQIVVNAQGRTLYALSPETTSHLLCKSSECLRFWPPVTVPSRNARLKAGPGVHGRLGILRRSNGTLQATLRGLPLYRFSLDHAKGEANGQDIQSFGGTWHAVTASSPTSSATPTSPTSPPPPSTTPPYAY
jgi:predicted lipoprotein with Yx(FWY)xxD motif